MSIREFLIWTYGYYATFIIFILIFKDINTDMVLLLISGIIILTCIFIYRLYGFFRRMEKK